MECDYAGSDPDVRTPAGKDLQPEFAVSNGLTGIHHRLGPAASWRTAAGSR